ncbi:MAG: DUF4392 domain-containing protein [Candidatus Rokuibacteriota bacterium]
MRRGTPGFDAVDHLLALDPGARGIASFFVPGAAGAAARALRSARRVLVVTGFCVPPGLSETDGPPGAAVLGRALRRLGARVRYVTDAPVVAPLAAALEALQEPAEVEVFDGAAAALLARERPTHLVAIERPGRARSGDYLSARGESVAPWNSPIDELFFVEGGLDGPLRGLPQDRLRRQSRRSTTRSRSRAPGPITIAVGDGGNEIGMGNVHARLARVSPLMAKIASVVRVDHLVVAGTSNWGAYGVVAALERLARGPLLHTPADERRLVEACVKAGAVDGIVRHAEPTVDGLPLDAHAAFVELLRLAGSPRGMMRRP